MYQNNNLVLSKRLNRDSFCFRPEEIWSNFINRTGRLTLPEDADLFENVKIVFFIALISNTTPIEFKLHAFDILEQYIKMNEFKPEEFTVLDDNQKLELADQFGHFISKFLIQASNATANETNFWKWIFALPFLYYFGQEKYANWSFKEKLQEIRYEEAALILDKVPPFGHFILNNIPYKEMAKLIIQDHCIVPKLKLSNLLVKMTYDIPTIGSERLQNLIDKLIEIVLVPSDSYDSSYWNDVLKTILTNWNNMRLFDSDYMEMFNVLFRITDIDIQIDEDQIRLMGTVAKLVLSKVYRYYYKEAKFLGNCLTNFKRLDQEIYETIFKSYLTPMIDRAEPIDCLNTYVRLGEYFPEEANNAMLDKLRELMKNQGKKKGMLERFTDRIKSMFVDVDERQRGRLIELIRSSILENVKELPCEKAIETYTNDSNFGNLLFLVPQINRELDPATQNKLTMLKDQVEGFKTILENGEVKMRTILLFGPSSERIPRLKHLDFDNSQLEEIEDLINLRYEECIFVMNAENAIHEFSKTMSTFTDKIDPKKRELANQSLQELCHPSKLFRSQYLDAKFITYCTNLSLI